MRRAPTRAASRSVRPMYRAVVAVAVFVAVAGTGVGFWLRGEGAAPVASATLGGLTATIGHASWVVMQNHEMDGQDGYQMPAQMMPGAPEGDDMRLGVKLSLTNPGAGARLFDLGTEFTLGGGRTDGHLAPQADTFGGLPRLTAHSQVDGVLYFDTPMPSQADPPLFLNWRRDGGQHRLLVDLRGTAPDHHSHG
ncbi:hypothetical protein [Dactylosporangium sp. NPDC048998]|uniref:hypothetical protein n=1 Tax=Dactylosporangium sp. NPDC048998 TaxID=3363976 RepID=UPI003721E6F4